MGFLTRLVQLKWFYQFARTVVLLYVRIARGLRVEGAAHVPRSGGLVIASNHISSWDPPVIGVSVPREVNFMAKKELFAGRWNRLLMLGLRAFPVDRERSDVGAVKEALRRLRKGRAIGIFVQGTRNAGDVEALDGAAFLAQRGGVPLLPAAIWREGRGFQVRFGPPVHPRGRDRQEIRALTSELVMRVNELLPSDRQLGTLETSADTPVERF